MSKHGKRAKDNENENKKKKKRIIIIFIILIIVASIILALNYDKWFKKSDGWDYEEQVMDETAGDYQEKPAEKNNEGQVIMPGWGTLHIKANTTNITSGVDFFNPKQNEGKYYMKFQLIVNDEVLYESGLVAPDKHIQSIKLSKPLSPGVYDAIVFIQPYKWDKKTPTNNGQVRIKLDVAS